MIENALCAAAATLALELDREAVRQGLLTFGATEDNPAGFTSTTSMGRRSSSTMPTTRWDYGTCWRWRAATEREKAG